MDEERFNISLRKLLKQFGVTAQREVEKAVDAARASGALTGPRHYLARAGHDGGRRAADRHRGQGDRSPRLTSTHGTRAGTPSMRPWRWAVAAGLGTGLFGCQASEGRLPGEAAAHDSASAPSGLAAKVAQYTPVRLTADLSALSRAGAADDPAAHRCRGRHGHRLPAAVLPRQRLAPRRALADPSAPPLRRDQLRAMGPSRRRPAVRGRRRRAARRRGSIRTT